jgi:hypothetical protein
VTVRPETPASGDCLETTVKGLSGSTFIWEVNGTNVQQNENSRYCLEDTSRDDVVNVTVGDAASGGTASITVSKSLPRILYTAFEFVAEGECTLLKSHANRRCRCGLCRTELPVVD